MKPTSKGKVAAVEELIGETRALFHRLRQAAGEIHGQGAVSAGLRGVMLDLDRNGAQTVPQMARSRPVSRQHIQALVNRLLAAGLAELAPNPAHQRSSLARLTPKGRQTLAAMAQKEAEVWSRLPLGLPKKEIRNATATLRTLRELLEGDAGKSRL